MNAPAAFKATYSDLRFVKSRKIAQVVLELPIEEATKFVEAFGAPDPSKETWCAVARLDLSKAIEEPTKARRRFSELPVGQQAALICDRESFRKFIRARTADEAADHIRQHCGVKSRSELSTNARAAGRFQTLTLEYELWLKEPL